MRNIYYIKNNQETITGTVVSKGETFTATAKLFPGDDFSEEIGKLIVKYRLEVLQRKRDLRNTNEVIEKLQAINGEEHKTKKFCEVSKHWMRFIQDACEERQAQLENIKFAKTMLDILEHTEGDTVKMVKMVLDKHLSVERTTRLIREIYAIQQTL